MKEIKTFLNGQESTLNYFIIDVPALQIELLGNNVTFHLPEMQWIRRFPWLQKQMQALIDGESFDISFNNGAFFFEWPKKPTSAIKIKLPIIRDPASEKNTAILPVAVACAASLPECISGKAPYFYSSLAACVAGKIYYFNYDYISEKHFLKYLKNNLGLSATDTFPEVLWGIRINPSKLPAPIGVSRETSFHLGYDDKPLPRHLNLSLLNICNLKCTICGTQNMDMARVKMDADTFDKIAELLFPYCDTVELNSLGEPTLCSYFAHVIKTITAHGCQIALQTNGTNMDDGILEALSAGNGWVSFSIDATGSLFEQQRVNAKWSVVANNVKRLLTKRDPDKLGVAISVAVTRRTLPDVENLCAWANEAGIDAAHIHFYEPIANGIEQRPTPEEQGELKKRLVSFIEKRRPRLCISFEGSRLNPFAAALPSAFRKYPSTRISYPSPRKLQIDSLYPVFACAAVSTVCSIMPEGDLYPCCRLYKFKKSISLDDRGFYEYWFGKEITDLRAQLEAGFRHGDGILPECKKCIEEHLL